VSDALARTGRWRHARRRPLDDVDRHLLRLLEQDIRTPNNALGGTSER
jgi:hypothetical protein